MHSLKRGSMFHALKWWCLASLAVGRAPRPLIGRRRSRLPLCGRAPFCGRRRGMPAGIHGRGGVGGIVTIT